MQKRWKNNKATKRAGGATVEFAALLPIFIVFAVLIVEVQEIMLRSMCNSHAAFASARLWLVGKVEEGYVQRHYEGSGMRGSFEVTPERSGSRVQAMTVTITDRYNILEPTGLSEGSFPGLAEDKKFRGATVSESVSGAGPQLSAAETDNDIMVR